MDNIDEYRGVAENSEPRIIADVAAKFMTKVYGWMCFALFLTALSAWTVANSPVAIEFIFSSKVTFFGIILAEFALVWFLSSRIESMSANVASLLFVFYSLMNGAVLSSILFAYDISTVFAAFATTGLTFAAMSVYGMVTKTDLSKIGNILFMALIGVIIATVVNIFLKSSMLEMIVNYVGVLVFVGLTAYDTQKLKAMSCQVGDSDLSSNYSILGALSLYLDFVNLFLYLLRILAGHRD